MATSTAFQRFRNSYFENPRRDGPDLAVLDQLTVEERGLAEAQLVQALRGESLYAIRALAHLNSRAAVPILQGMLPKAKGVTRVWIASALWQIERDETVIECLLDALKKKWFGGGSARFEAAIALGAIPEGRVFRALTEASREPDAVVSANALRSLALICDLEDAYWAYDRQSSVSAEAFQAAERDLRRRIEAVGAEKGW
ncbi:hypothetical protein SCOR_26105 [Sulfidibacter corallicola]|uniref:HEAT repeat domain-containing protein n=1 Tax=Sulfidibacter corallicola TaxID=2818388 RepID=A0A8A4TSV9_SULCO|nr:hypothetical protein [Sulfidibacter corallicola]QTD52132.1 hypothetical protein J3U87_06625 [Sulfidibacter corallicola]